MRFAEETYSKNIESIKEQLNKLEKELTRFSLLRFVIAAIIIGLDYYFYKNSNLKLIVLSTVIGMIIFGVVAFLHDTKINKKNKMTLLLKYNEKGIKRINGQWKTFEDYGKEFIDIKHNFSSDLDIFGKNSLFQWINVTNSKFGRKVLAKMLSMEKAPGKTEILDNQDAIVELTEKRDFCKNVFLQSADNKYSDEKIEEFISWMKDESKIALTPKYIPYLFLSVTYIILFFTIIGKLKISVLVLDLLINFLVIKLTTKQLESIIRVVISNKRKIVQYADVIKTIDQEEFNSRKLKNLKDRLSNGKVSAVSEMNKLKDIINWLGDSTGNAFYFIINLFMMSDIFILHNLEVWRKENGKVVEEWLYIMGEFEALISLSNLAFENDNWTYPEIDDNGAVEVRDAGHPLLGAKAKVNDFSLCNENKVALITGSNMSGKSTFLRTIGFNMILAYLGLPTCSSYFRCGIFNLYTCMRTQDNLEENTSSFYAEILRIKLVIEAAKKGEKVFFLLDEIFKGTNSKDRHDGATILIEQLVKANGVGLVSTHDMELCDLENIHPWLINFNFQEYYKDNKIMFDYKLRKGKSTTQNAKYLMKMAGIEL